MSSVLSLNLSGPQVNPVEFFRNNNKDDIIVQLHNFIKSSFGDNQQEQISKLYKVEGEQYYNYRYSVLRKYIPLKSMTKEKYFQKWDQELQKYFEKYPEYKTTLENAEKKEIKKLADKVTVDDLRSKIKDFDWVMYCKFAEFFMDKTDIYKDLYKVVFLDKKKKTKKLVTAIKKLEPKIVFLQEISSTQYDIIFSKLETRYSFSPKFPDGELAGNFSVILYDPREFGPMEHFNLDPSLKETVAMRNKDYVLVSSHFPSKTNKKANKSVGYQNQLVTLLKNLETVKSKIIIGMDANHDITDEKSILKDMNNNDEILQEYERYLEKYNIGNCKSPTTNKERTMMQVQLEKVEKNDQGRKDFILFRGVTCKKCNVLRMDGENPDIKNERIPSDIHPADHYIVGCDYL